MFHIVRPCIETAGFSQGSPLCCLILILTFTFFHFLLDCDLSSSPLPSLSLCPFLPNLLQHEIMTQDNVQTMIYGKCYCCWVFQMSFLWRFEYQNVTLYWEMADRSFKPAERCCPLSVFHWCQQSLWGSENTPQYLKLAWQLHGNKTTQGFIDCYF